MARPRALRGVEGDNLCTCAMNAPNGFQGWCDVYLGALTDYLLNADYWKLNGPMDRSNVVCTIDSYGDGTLIPGRRCQRRDESGMIKGRIHPGLAGNDQSIL